MQLKAYKIDTYAMNKFFSLFLLDTNTAEFTLLNLSYCHPLFDTWSDHVVCLSVCIPQDVSGKVTTPILSSKLNTAIFVQLVNLT